MASARETAIGHHDVRVGAGPGKLHPIHSVAAPDGEQPPRPTIPHDIGNAGIIAALGEALLVEVRRLAVECGRFAHQIPHEVAASAAKQYGRAIVPDHRKVLTIARHEQCRHWREGGTAGASHKDR